MFVALTAAAPHEALAQEKASVAGATLSVPENLEYTFSSAFPLLAPLDQPNLNAIVAEPGPREVVLPGLSLPWASQRQEFKKQLYDKYGLSYVISYQQLAQYATETLPHVTDDLAIGGWFGTSLTWTPVDRGGPYEGSLVVSGGWRGPVGGDTWPAPFGPAYLGSSWSSYTFTSWNDQYRLENLFWDQKIGGDLTLRFGNQAPQAVLNTFRFKNGATQFTASPLEFAEAIPYPTFGPGFSFRWRPSALPGFYINGNVNSMNGNPGVANFTWDDIHADQLFMGLEVGKQWRRDNDEYDQLSLLVFHAGTRNILNPQGPNEAGGGFKILGEKQWGRLVGFANYTYNTARGGGISTTFSDNTAVAGLAYLRPFGIRGEIAAAGMWTQPFKNIFPGSGQREQYGVEAYWNMALTDDSTLTPGIQLIENPSFNPGVDFLVIPSLKFRLAL